MLQQREKWMALVVGVLLTGLALRWGYGAIGGWYESRQTQIDALEKQARDKRRQAAEAQRAADHRAEWYRRSLPANPELARSLYQKWLLETLDRSGWGAVDLTIQSSAGRRGLYHRLAFNVQARGTLSELVKFLFYFYQADFLHQVRRLAIEPAQGSDELEISLGIEAMAMRDAKSRDSLSEGVGTRLAQTDVDAYLKSIVGRNVFAPYVPPKPPPPKVVERPPPPPPPAFDVAKHAYVTAILAGETGELEAWVNIRTTGKTLKLGVGAPFQVGEMAGVVAEIGERDVVLRVGDRLIRVALGQTLREGHPTSLRAAASAP